MFLSIWFLRYVRFFFFLMIRRPPRSTLDRSSAASDVYKRQVLAAVEALPQDLRDAITFREVEGMSYKEIAERMGCLLYTSPSPRDRTRSRMPSSA